jgi:putative DNA primase/helicase
MTAETLAKALGGRKAGSGWVARCPAHDDRTPSLSLADGHDGRLLVKCWAGCSAHNVLAALRRCELIGANKLRGVIDARGGSSDAEDRKKRALDLWNAAFPVSGTLAAQYLLARGLALPSLHVLRFHPRCPHPSGANLPAMIGLVEHVDHGPTAIHRTFISADGSGKAAVERDKASLGPVAGVAVRLAQVRAGQWLLVAEGLETTLSVMHACALPGWAALSAGGIKSLVLLPMGHIRPVSEYFVTVAETGARKSASDTEATWPIRKCEQALRETRDAELPNYVNDKTAWEKARAEVVKRGKGNRATIKAALDALGPAPAPPLEPMLTCPEPTFEGLCKLFAVGQPS